MALLPTNFSDMNGAQLLAAYNTAARASGAPTVARFADRKTALRRTETAVTAYNAIRASKLRGDAAPAKKVAKVAHAEGCPACGATADQTVGRVVERGGRQEELDDHIGQCHSCGHTYNINTRRPAKFRGDAAQSATRSAAIAASWDDPAVAAARAARHGVTIHDKNGKLLGTWKSLRAAFVALGLPLAPHIRVRGQLVAAGSIQFGTHTLSLATE
jgi:hypothetical protein